MASDPEPFTRSQSNSSANEARNHCTRSKSGSHKQSRLIVSIPSSVGITGVRSPSDAICTYMIPQLSTSRSLTVMNPSASASSGK
ncbi:hypothetical protein C8Q77DRAFT_427834 [Trametes polyzona]|nr:hypothetical protein C8Q77DRAFT_427834 [Trametes polyzona]